MKKHRISEIIGHIDQKYIDEATAYTGEERAVQRNRRDAVVVFPKGGFTMMKKRWLTVAVALLLVAAFVTSTLTAYALGQSNAYAQVAVTRRSHVIVTPAEGWAVRHGPVIVTDEYIYYEEFELASLEDVLDDVYEPGDYDDIYGTAAICRVRLDGSGRQVVLRSDEGTSDGVFGFFTDVQVDAAGNVWAIKILSRARWEDLEPRGLQKTELIQFNKEGEQVQRVTLSDQPEMQGVLFEQICLMDDGQIALVGRRNMTESEQEAAKEDGFFGWQTTRICVVNEQIQCQGFAETTEALWARWIDDKLYAYDGDALMEVDIAAGKVSTTRLSANAFTEQLSTPWPTSSFLNHQMVIGTGNGSTNLEELSWDMLEKYAASGKTLPNGTAVLALFRYDPQVNTTPYDAILELYFIQ